ncbi:MAG TPA: integrase core domain-containing protein, partial [Feifaniaceae bacterium]|nr:integrase core domain-containing protein [Feifaniaceae bacterium]
QYTSHAFQKLLKASHIKQSFSPSGRPRNNAVMEAFFSGMKKEELFRTNYHSIAEFKERISKYVDFYNIARPHSTLAYKTPNSYEALFYDKQKREAN